MTLDSFINKVEPHGVHNGHPPAPGVLRHHWESKQLYSINEVLTEGKMQYYIDESVKACDAADFVVKYEDLCFDTENEVNRIKEFFALDIPIPTIIPSKSIGIGKDHYSKFDMSKLGY